MYRSKNTKTRQILKLLRHRALTTAEFLESILPIGYYDSYKVARNFLGPMDIPRFNLKEWQRQEEKRFYALMAKLRNEGMIEKNKFDGKTLWKLTEAGLKKLNILKGQKAEDFPEKIYKKEKSKDLTLVIFDIPEKFKHKRVWLRERLKELGFRLLQKSVWIGDYQLPADFIHDLRDLQILPCLHVLKVYRTGSLINVGRE